MDKETIGISSWVIGLICGMLFMGYMAVDPAREERNLVIDLMCKRAHDNQGSERVTYNCNEKFFTIKF